MTGVQTCALPIFLNHLKSISKKRKKGTKIRFYLSTKKVLAKKKSEYDKLCNDNSDDDVIEIDEEEMKQIPRRLVTLNPKWVGKMDNGKDCVLDESFVLMTFGASFANEIKPSNHGYVDVPVGDFKMSRLHENPMLCVPGAPSVHDIAEMKKYMQKTVYFRSNYFNLSFYLSRSVNSPAHLS